jgi:NDP-sugar pyrophosphorylase family protein
VAALILAGGLGTRLRPVIGEDLPKSLVDVAGRPFIDGLLSQLARQGIRDVYLLVGHGADAMRAHVGDGARWELRVRYSQEREPLGTGGALRHALPKLTGARFVVMNGDSFVEVALPAVVDAHDRAHRDLGVLATLVLVREEDTERFGSVELGPEGRITAFREKASARGPGLVSAGVYVMERAAIASIPPGRAVSLEREVWPSLIDGGLAGHVVRGAFADLGTPRSLEALRSEPDRLLGLGSSPRDA